jgi:hypothetical protein
VRGGLDLVLESLEDLDPLSASPFPAEARSPTLMATGGRGGSLEGWALSASPALAPSTAGLGSVSPAGFRVGEAAPLPLPLPAFLPLPSAVGGALASFLVAPPPSALPSLEVFLVGFFRNGGGSAPLAACATNQEVAPEWWEEDVGDAGNYDGGRALVSQQRTGLYLIRLRSYGLLP